MSKSYSDWFSPTEWTDWYRGEGNYETEKQVRDGISEEVSAPHDAVINEAVDEVTNQKVNQAIQGIKDGEKVEEVVGGLVTDAAAKGMLSGNWLPSTNREDHTKDVAVIKKCLDELRKGDDPKHQATAAILEILTKRTGLTFGEKAYDFLAEWVAAPVMNFLVKASRKIAEGAKYCLDGIKSAGRAIKNFFAAIYNKIAGGLQKLTESAVKVGRSEQNVKKMQTMFKTMDEELAKEMKEKKQAVTKERFETAVTKEAAKKLLGEMSKDSVAKVRKEAKEKFDKQKGPKKLTEQEVFKTCLVGKVREDLKPQGREVGQLMAAYNKLLDKGMPERDAEKAVIGKVMPEVIADQGKADKALGDILIDWGKQKLQATARKVGTPIRKGQGVKGDSQVAKPPKKYQGQGQRER
jgi:hypothetical protein